MNGAAQPVQFGREEASFICNLDGCQNIRMHCQVEIEVVRRSRMNTDGVEIRRLNDDPSSREDGITIALVDRV